MIQLNLLPDIKLQFIKSKRSKRTVTVFATLAIVVSVGLLAIMISLTVFQKRHIADLKTDINNFQKSLEDTPDLAKILTIQNQLSSLPAMYSARPVTSRLFSFVEQTTPPKIGIAHIILDFSDNSLSIQGTSDSLESVNRYVDTLKFTKYKVKVVDSEEQSAVETVAFTNVVLSEFGRDSKAATYTIKLNFDHILFEADKEVTLVVPKTVTTRSETELPDTGLFNTETTN